MAFMFTNPESVLYEGQFFGSLVEGVEVTGPGRVRISHSGFARVQVDFARGSNSENAVLAAYMPNGSLGPSSRVEWKRVQLKADRGQFEITQKPHLAQLQMDSESGIHLEIDGLRAVYSVTDSGPARYWSIPIYNLLWDSGPINYPEISDHPMWLPHNKDRADKVFPPSVIAFLFDNKPASFKRCVTTGNERKPSNLDQRGGSSLL